MRTFEELRDAVSNAHRINDAAELMACAVELDALATAEAEAVASRSRGWAFYLHGDYSAALEHYHRALVMHEELGNRNGMASIYGNIGNVHSSTGDYPAALEHWHLALAIHEELGERRGVASVTGNIGNMHGSTGDYPAALEHYHRALALYEELGERSGMASVIGNIGLVYGSTGNYPAALEHYHRALAINEELGNRYWAAANTCNIGNVHQSTGNYHAALEHYHRALSMYEELGNRSEATVTANIGNVHHRTGNYAAALEYFHRALAVHEELGERTGTARVTGNILAAMIESELYDEAEALLQKMDAMTIHAPDVVIMREQSRAELQQQTGDSDEAVATLAAALELARNYSLMAEQATIHKLLRDLALTHSDLASYVEHNNEYIRINEEVNGKEATLKMAMQEKQREIDAERKETERHMAVLHSTLPKHIADRVARGEVVNDSFDNAAVIFLDIVGFTSISDRIPSGHVVHLLEQIFTALDTVCKRYDVVKIKTIGDSYMAVSFESVVNAAECALDMIASLDDLVITMPPALGDTSWTNDVGDIKVRVGIHCGPLTAGVIGTDRMQYDVWGDTVNVASRMESSGEAGRVHVSQAFADYLKTNQESKIKNPIAESHEVPLVTSHLSLVTTSTSLVTIERGSMDIKGKGLMKTYWLT